ncbi:GerAB/ArcD/ProY family transporter [Cohnella faecalis]|uniref:GerAB/ArcD/ProY family transporter n=1 Tax=Cohnella faecalis TaxID=2315694 RepID=UPI001314E923|nr:GerAB/ArcD/ProY family transporter [Cohnella faecalis]
MLGKPTHFCIMLVFSFFFIHVVAYLLREFVDLFTLAYLIKTPSWAVASLLMFAVACISQIGAWGIFRFAQACFLLIGFMFLILPIYLHGELNPTVWHGIWRLSEGKAIWQMTYNITPWYGELFLLLFFIPELKRAASVRGTIWFASIAGTYILTSVFLLSLLVFGPNLAGGLTYPLLELTGFIRIGDFMQNLDPVIVTIWFTAFFIKLSILFYSGVLTFSHALAIKEHRIFSMPLAALTVVMSIVIAPNPVEMNRFFDRSWSTFALFVECLPFIYVLAAWLRKRAKSAESNAKKPGEAEVRS